MVLLLVNRRGLRWSLLIRESTCINTHSWICDYIFICLFEKTLSSGKRKEIVVGEVWTRLRVGLSYSNALYTCFVLQFKKVTIYFPITSTGRGVYVGNKRRAISLSSLYRVCKSDVHRTDGHQDDITEDRHDWKLLSWFDKIGR